MHKPRQLAISLLRRIVMFATEPWAGSRPPSTTPRNKWGPAIAPGATMARTLRASRRRICLRAKKAAPNATGQPHGYRQGWTTACYPLQRRAGAAIVMANPLQVNLLIMSLPLRNVISVIKPQLHGCQLASLIPLTHPGDVMIAIPRQVRQISQPGTSSPVRSAMFATLLQDGPQHPSIIIK